jgi:hypothetical protein
MLPFKYIQNILGIALGVMGLWGLRGGRLDEGYAMRLSIARDFGRENRLLIGVI